jgi:hypothetical protein
MFDNQDYKSSDYFFDKYNKQHLITLWKKQ